MPATQAEVNTAKDELTKQMGDETYQGGLVPESIVKLGNDYRAKIAHTFVLHGNISDYQDDSGYRSYIQDLLARTLDVNYQSTLAKNNKEKKNITDKGTRVLAFYSLNNGLEFAHENSRKQWEEMMAIMNPELASNKDDTATPWTLIIHPPDFASTLNTLNLWFRGSKKLNEQNQIARATGQPEEALKPEIGFRIVFKDCDALFPAGSMAQLNFMDRNPIVMMRNWAQDEAIGNRNMIILLTKHLTDIHESIRCGSSRVSSILVKQPKLDERETWIRNFGKVIREQAKKGKSWRIAGRAVEDVNYADGFDEHLFAIQSAGMSRYQLEDVIMQSWLNNVKLDFSLVRERKQRAIEEEYEGIVEFFEPEHGFETVGGHDCLKLYFNREIIVPLQAGDKRGCSRGVLLVGPPGTAKTHLAQALAKEAKMNFMVGNLGRLFGGIVGETESRTRKFLEAVDSAAPVILFLDEIDSVLSSGRSSPGDSGTSGRVFNSIMTFLSDSSRAGKVVVVAATNRPDLLDSALIRQQRFDAILPALPPAKGDLKGRALILKALETKLDLKWSKELATTANNKSKDSGIGKLLCDSRIWTGAEMETVVKKAWKKTVFAIQDKMPHKTEDEKKALQKAIDEAEITLENWNLAMSYVIPNTREVDAMIDLALLYANDLEYCPPEWRDRAGKKDEIQSSMQNVYHSGILESDREL